MSNFVRFYIKHLRKYLAVFVGYIAGLIFLLFVLGCCYLLPEQGDSLAGVLYYYLLLILGITGIIVDLAVHIFCRTYVIRFFACLVTMLTWLITTFIFSLSLPPAATCYQEDAVGDLVCIIPGWTDWGDYTLCVGYVLLYLVAALFISFLGRLCFKTNG